mmetsp:Transcript_12546/g.24065  ORF Transcript_12546/g.24065 Transcript_12546/m.24065 type:complete len:524 (+) Transcript_12546:114-1685(+)|eukprot:scaffold1248_cov170-Amphora_coffeaeformis.AAC.13
MSNEGYEKVPDVENGTAPVAESSYDDLDDDQAAVLKKLDNAMTMSHFDFSMPAVDPAELVSQGNSFLQSMFLPTLTAVATVLAGLALNYQAQYSLWAETAVRYFPYANALIIFYSSVTPLSNRFKDAMKPVFDKSAKVQEDVCDRVGMITVQVDTSIDAIQADVKEVLKPIKPIIDNASSKAGPLKQMDPTLDIPDASEIDEEFDELQGKVGAKVKDAQKALDLEQCIPGRLKSLDHFYWQVIFPILILALVLQLALAWCTTSGTMPTAKTTTTRYLRGDPYTYYDYESYPAAPALRHLKKEPVDATPPPPVEDTKDESPVEEVQEEAVQLLDEAKEGVTAGVDAAEKDVQQAVDWTKEEANQGMGAIQDQVMAIQAEYHTKQLGYELEDDQYASQKKGITIIVVLSYLMSLLQMAVVFLFTSPRVKAFGMDRGMSKVTDRTNRTLREYGVTTTVEDIMGTRMGRIRKKLLKLFHSVGKIQHLLNKIPDIPGLGSGQIDRVEGMLGKAGSKKQRSFLGGLFNK